MRLYVPDRPSAIEMLIIGSPGISHKYPAPPIGGWMRWVSALIDPLIKLLAYPSANPARGSPDTDAERHRVNPLSLPSSPTVYSDEESVIILTMKSPLTVWLISRKSNHT